MALTSRDTTAANYAPADSTFHSDVNEFGQAFQEGNMIGFAFCTVTPSGCYHTGQDLGYSQVPVYRVLLDFKDSGLFGNIYYRFQLLDPLPAGATPKAIFVTGCGIDASIMTNFLGVLNKHYNITSIQFLFKIIPAHHSTIGFPEYNGVNEKSEREYFRKKGYEFRTFFPRVSCQLPNNDRNIGIPRFHLKPSTFKVPKECFGLLRLRQQKCPLNIPFLKEFFRQVANMGENSKIKPMVIILERSLSERQEITQAANESNVDLVFYDKSSEYSLPKEAFLHILNEFANPTADDKEVDDKEIAPRGIVGFDGYASECVRQALSLGTPVLVQYHNSILTNVYEELVDLVSPELRSTAKVIFGLSNNYELLKNADFCKRIFAELKVAMHESHARNDLFRSLIGLPNKETSVAEPNEIKRSKTVGLFASFEDCILSQLKRITNRDWQYQEGSKNKFCLILEDKSLRTGIMQYLQSENIKVTEADSRELVIFSDSIQASQLIEVLPYISKIKSTRKATA